MSSGQPSVPRPSEIFYSKLVPILERKVKKGLEFLKIFSIIFLNYFLEYTRFGKSC